MNRSVKTAVPALLSALWSDADYLRRLFTIALPMMSQQLVMSLLGMLNALFVGQLGAVPVAAVGLANQIFFLVNLLLFGIYSGAAIFTAQYWGVQDIPNIRRTLGLALLLGVAGALAFSVLGFFFPARALRIYTTDPAVIALGSPYLRIFSLSFLFFAISLAYNSVLRSLGLVRIPLVTTFIALSMNALLGYLLIFGKLGFPRLGIDGAAIATVVARAVELILVLAMTYRQATPAAARLSELFSLNRTFSFFVLRRILPVTLNEILWSFGVTTYSIIYARMSTEAVAAINMMSTLDNLGMVVLLGIASATAVLVGNWIGAGDERIAYRYAAHSLTLGVCAALVIGAIIFLIAPYYVALYNVDPAVQRSATQVIGVLAAILWLRMINMVLYLGAFRSGGDTRFALILDGLTIWVVGVPMALLAAFALHLPVHLVFLFSIAEELTKAVIGLWRFRSRRWIHNLVKTD